VSGDAVVQILLNGETRQLAVGTSVEEVVKLLDAPAKGVAVACNGTIVPRSEWGSTVLEADDCVEVLTVAAGG
jgi:sulfur carrier protein